MNLDLFPGADFQQRAREVFLTAFAEGIRPDPILTVSEWADRYRILPRKSSAEPGRWRTSRTPYLREVMDALTPTTPVQQIVIMKGTQLGFTEVGNNWFGYVVHIAPGPMMMAFPTIDLAKHHSKAKIHPSVEVVEELSSRVREPRKKDSDTTVLFKDFPGGFLQLAGANSGASMRSRSIRYLFLDDVDGYPGDLVGEGSPVGLAKNRTDAFPNRKIYMVSSPTIRGESEIERAYQESDERHYHVPCPHCRKLQWLQWGNLKFKHQEYRLDEDPVYQCGNCGESIEERYKAWMLENGRWIAASPGRPVRGYHLSSLYSPPGWLSWAALATEFLAAKKNRDAEALKTFVNTRLAETWEERGDQVDDGSLASRSRLEPVAGGKLPAAALVLTAAVDTQDDRLEYEVKAWGRGEENWSVAWGQIHGDPVTDPKVWDALDEILGRTFEHESGVWLPISQVCVDSGGHATEQVYRYVKPRFTRRIYAVKGENVANAPLVGRFTRSNNLGVRLYRIGVDTAKGILMSRLRLEEPGPGYMHFPSDRDEEFFKQLTAEKRVAKWTNGRKREVWVKTRARNEALDLNVYNLAALAILAPAWDRLEENLRAAAGRQKETAPEAARRPARGNYARRWRQGI